MKFAKNLIAGAALLSGVLAFTASASADWSRRSDYRRDRRELAEARRELREDFRRGAGRRELARDRAAIARERRDLWQYRRDGRYDRWHDRWDDRRYYGWRNRNGWWGW